MGSAHTGQWIKKLELHKWSDGAKRLGCVQPRNKETTKAVDQEMREEDNVWVWGGM